MGCRTARADSIGRPFHEDASGPVVLLVFARDDLRARFAYQLAASGFAVVTDIGGLRPKPDVIVAELDVSTPGGISPITAISEQSGLGGLPVIAVTDDVGDRTQTLARRRGCAAVCRTTCSSTALTAGIRAVLGRRER